MLGLPKKHKSKKLKERVVIYKKDDTIFEVVYRLLLPDNYIRYRGKTYRIFNKKGDKSITME